MYGIYANIKGYIDGIHVTIYSSTMDPLGYSTIIIVPNSFPANMPIVSLFTYVTSVHDWAPSHVCCPLVFAV